MSSCVALPNQIFRDFCTSSYEDNEPTYDFTGYTYEEFKWGFLSLSCCSPLFNAIDRLGKIPICFKMQYSYGEVENPACHLWYLCLSEKTGV